MALNIPLILHAVLEEYNLPLHGHHSVTHWARVLENRLRLAQETKAICSFEPNVSDAYSASFRFSVKIYQEIFEFRTSSRYTARRRKKWFKGDDSSNPMNDMHILCRQPFATDTSQRSKAHASQD
jgi:hypothetical protein